MTAGVTAKVNLSLIGQFTGTNDLSSVIEQIAQQLSIDYQPGSGAGKANEVFADTRTLAASANETLDLSGSLVDAFGATIAFTKVKTIIIIADAANTNNVVVGAAGSNPFLPGLGGTTPTIAIQPGDWIVLNCKAGFAVANSSTDNLKVANSGAGTGVNYSIVLIGE